MRHHGDYVMRLPLEVEEVARFVTIVDRFNQELGRSVSVGAHKQVLAPSGIVPLVVGNSGVQMDGWSHARLAAALTWKGVRMRISGFPGRVIARLRANPVALPIGQIISAIEAGRIDAAEAGVPALDMAQPSEKHAP